LGRTLRLLVVIFSLTQTTGTTNPSINFTTRAHTNPASFFVLVLLRIVATIR